MKKTTKIIGLAAGILTLAGMVFTSCDPNVVASINKDDFRGTWLTYDLDEDGTVVPVYDGGNYYKVRWYFDGTAENPGAQNAIFRQHLINYGSNVEKVDGEYRLPTPTNETYWFGAYDITANSGYSKGKFFLKYQAGFDIDDALKSGVYAEDGVLKTGGTPTTEYSAEIARGIVAVLDTWTLDDFVAWCDVDVVPAPEGEETKTGLESDVLANLGFKERRNADNPSDSRTASDNVGCYIHNNVTLQVRKENGKLKCSDIEYFRFNFKEKKLSGYTRMMGTIKDKNGTSVIGGTYNQWATADDAATLPLNNKKSNSYGYAVSNSTAWSGTDTRYMARIDVSSNEYEPTFLCSNTKTNDQMFSLTDTDDKLDYGNPDAKPEQ